MCKFVDRMNFTDNLFDLHKVLLSNFIFFLDTSILPMNVTISNFHP